MREIYVLFQFWKLCIIGVVVASSIAFTFVKCIEEEDSRKFNLQDMLQSSKLLLKIPTSTSFAALLRMCSCLTTRS